VQDTQAFGLTVIAVDQSGNPDPDFFGSVALAIASPAGSSALTGTTTVVASGGVATFTGLKLQALGNFTLQATTAGLTPATTGNINVTAGPASQILVITQPPDSMTAGNAFSVQVEAQDALGYLATGFNGILTAVLAGGPSGATLLGSPNAQAGSGVAWFTGLSLDKAGGGYTIQLGGTGMTGTTTSPFTVTPAAPSKVTFSAPPPTQVTAGAPINLGVAITDPYGNVESSYNGLVTVALTNRPAPGPLNGDLARNASGGQALFSGLTLDTASPGYIIQASSGGLSPATFGPITVVPAAASRLVVSVQPPTNLTAGTEFGMAVTVEDAYGNPVTGYNGSVSLALQGPSGAGLKGGPLSLTATGGMADFPPTLAIDTAGSGWTIRATGGGLTPATTAPITVTGLPSTHLAVVAEPPATVAPGAPFGFVVAAVDQYGNVDPNFHGQIAIALAPGSSATLGGASLLATSGGEASFQGLTLGGLSAPVTILATTSGMPGASTTPIAPTTPASQGSSTPLVTMTNVQVVFKKNKVIGLTLSFSGGLNPGEAQSLGEYQIIVAGKKNSFTAKNAKKLPLLSAVYNAANHSVALTLKKPLAVKKPTELVVQGTGPSGLQDGNGNLIDGNHDGQAGGNAVALLSGKGKKVTAHTMAVTSAMVDMLLEHGDLMAPRKKGH
jgi:hypothetical protein